MAFCTENNHISDVLNLPISDRCNELSKIFELCSLRELEEIFPTIVQSVFGIGASGFGWGLRATTRQNAPQNSNILQAFFAPMGPMFSLCYRLLNDSIKFEFSLELLPQKVTAMMQTGQYSLFYADLMNVDPFRRQVNSLLLNAFDYYILHFVIHATFPLHKMYPAAMQVHSERLKTVYFFLSADYLCAFLPSSPDSIVLHSKACPTVKAPQPMPVQNLQPKRTPTYIKIPNMNLYPNNNATGLAAQATRNADSLRVDSWRTESVLHFFIDTWLRYDADETRDLPSSEFMRVVRILVKQTHAFANSSGRDQTSMANLRKIAHPMMRANIFTFLKSIIDRWPLDSTLSVVLELWLSYIQPWRYTYELQCVRAVPAVIPISNRFDSFIVDNLAVYTQIFVYILLRFERLDFTSLRNAIMLHRLVKIFTQTTLPKKLRQAELVYGGNSLTFNSTTFNSSIDHGQQYRPSSSLNSSDVYTPLFGTEIQRRMEEFIKFIGIASIYVEQDISDIQNEIVEQKKSYSFIRKLLANMFEDVSPTELKLQDIAKIPEILESSIRLLGEMFNVELPNISLEQLEPRQRNCTQNSFSLLDNSEYFDISKISPQMMMNNLANITMGPDPALLPIQSNECKALVRFLHQVSCRLNEMYGEDMQLYWKRADIWGKLARRILSPPMTAQWFDKPRGVNMLCEQHLPPRLCLRHFASYKALTMVALSFILGQVMWGAPSYGVISLLLLYIAYLFTQAFCYG